MEPHPTVVEMVAMTKESQGFSTSAGHTEKMTDPYDRADNKFCGGPIPADLAALRREVDRCLAEGISPSPGIVRGLVEDNLRLQSLVNGYEEQRRMMAAILGTTGILRTKRALKKKRLDRIAEKIPAEMTQEALWLRRTRWILEYLNTAGTCALRSDFPKWREL